MQSRVLGAMLFVALVAAPVWAGKKGGHGGGHSSGATHGSSSHAASGSSAKLSGGPSAGMTVPETMQGYHSSAGYGSLYGWGYNDWTRNGWHDGKWNGIPYNDKTSQPRGPSQPTMKFGGSKASSAGADETQLIQQQIARRRAQQAQPNAAPSQPATPAATQQRP